MSQTKEIIIGWELRCIQKLCFRTLIVALCIFSPPAGAWQAGPKPVTQLVDDAEIARENTLNGYTVTERYSVFRNDASEPAATRTVKTVFTKGQGKKYEEVSRTGSSAIQKYVLDRILSEEEKISKGDDRKNVLVISANYTLEQDKSSEPRSGRNCLVFKLTPKRKSPYLLDGRVWVDAQNFHLVRVEGRPSAKPSFWAGHPWISRDYQDIQGVSLATYSKSESKNLFWGTTAVIIHYDDYHLFP